MKQPFYVIDFSSASCRFEIRVNDIPVIDMNMDGQVASQTPINYAILESGIQKVSAYIFPLQDQYELLEGASLSFKINLFDVENGFDFQKEIIDVGEIALHKKAVKTPVSVAVTDSFQATVPYKLDGWKNGRDLTKIKYTNEKLREAYTRIAYMIKNKDYQALENSMMIREQRMATSLYLSENESSARLKSLIDDFESGFIVKPIPSDAIVHLYGNSRIGVLKKLNGESALFLENPETEEELMLDLAFYIPNDTTEFEII